MFFNKLNWIIKIRCASLPKAVFGPSFSSTKSWEPGYYIFGEERGWVYPTFKVILCYSCNYQLHSYFSANIHDPTELRLWFQSTTLKWHTVWGHLFEFFSEKPFLASYMISGFIYIIQLSDRLAYFNWSTKDWWRSIEQCLHLDSALVIVRSHNILNPIA